jgi:hypothetical protein
MGLSALTRPLYFLSSLAAVCNLNATIVTNANPFQCSATSLVGDRCAATCKDGFAAGAQGAPTVTCQTGGWSAALGSCVAGETAAAVRPPVVVYMYMYERIHCICVRVHCVCVEHMSCIRC